MPGIFKKFFFSAVAGTFVLSAVAQADLSQNTEVGGGPSLRSIDKMNSARITFYDPDVNGSMEGGPKTRYGEPINSVENAIENGRPISVAADIYGKFGKACNQRQQRCLLLIYTQGFDHLYPDYHKKFPNLPRNSFIALVEDTGGDFFGKGGSRFDIAVRSRRLAAAVPAGFNDHVRWTRLANPCGDRASGRQCDLNTASLAPIAIATLNISANDL